MFFHGPGRRDVRTVGEYLEVVMFDDPVVCDRAFFDTESAGALTGSGAVSTNDTEDRRSLNAFQAITHKRQRVIEHLLRHTLMLCSEKPARSSTSAGAGAGTGTGAVSSAPTSANDLLTRFALLSLFPVLDAIGTTNIQARLRIVRVLVDLLQTSPILSLANADEDLFSNLVSLLQPGPDVSVAGTAALLGVTLHRGQLRHIFRNLTDLLSSSASSGQSLHELPSLILPYLKQIDVYVQNARVHTVLTSSTMLASWPHHVEPTGDWSIAAVSHAPSVPVPASVACDDAFLYVLTRTTLFKVGAGHCGSVPGRIYCHHTLLAEHPVPAAKDAWLACVDSMPHHVLYRSADMPNGIFAFKLRRDTLVRDGIMHSVGGRDDDTTASHYVHMNSDGHLLHLFRVVDEMNVYSIDTFSVLPGKMQRVRECDVSQACVLMLRPITPPIFSFFRLSN
jgi:hypothetical protein